MPTIERATFRIDQTPIAKALIKHLTFAELAEKIGVSEQWRDAVRVPIEAKADAVLKEREQEKGKVGGWPAEATRRLGRAVRALGREDVVDALVEWGFPNASKLVALEAPCERLDHLQRELAQRSTCALVPSVSPLLGSPSRSSPLGTLEFLGLCQLREGDYPAQWAASFVSENGEIRTPMRLTHHQWMPGASLAMMNRAAHDDSASPGGDCRIVRVHRPELSTNSTADMQHEPEGAMRLYHPQRNEFEKLPDEFLAMSSADMATLSENERYLAAAIRTPTGAKLLVFDRVACEIVADEDLPTGMCTCISVSSDGDALVCDGLASYEVRRNGGTPVRTLLPRTHGFREFSLNDAYIVENSPDSLRDVVLRNRRDGGEITLKYTEGRSASPPNPKERPVAIAFSAANLLAVVAFADRPLAIFDLRTAESGDVIRPATRIPLEDVGTRPRILPFFSDGKLTVVYAATDSPDGVPASRILRVELTGPSQGGHAQAF